MFLKDVQRIYLYISRGGMRDSNRFSRRNGETELKSTCDRPFKRVVVHERGKLPLS